MIKLPKNELDDSRRIAGQYYLILYKVWISRNGRKQAHQATSDRIKTGLFLLAARWKDVLVLGYWLQDALPPEGGSRMLRRLAGTASNERRSS